MSEVVEEIKEEDRSNPSSCNNDIVDPKQIVISVDDEESKEPVESFETRWKCWKCKRLYQLRDMCVKCSTMLNDYPGTDLNSILFEVKTNSSS